MTNKKLKLGHKDFMPFLKSLCALKTGGQPPRLSANMLCSPTQYPDGLSIFSKKSANSKTRRVFY
ncbi:MAG TPA: hypothetical protein CFH81_05170 [Sulfurovum sp. UBA12169]|nr:MAG TPA: hypothetical protein CFH81_05170 [Sulfurovum sp. UBA12169]